MDAAELNAFIRNKLKLQAESLKAEFLEQMQQEMKKAEQAFAMQVEENEERHRRDLHHIYEQFALARQRVFGRSSERHLNQLDLSFDEAEVLANGSTEAADKTDITAAKTHIDPQAQEIQAKSRPRGKRSPIPADVKRVRVVIAVPEGDRVCPCCGKTMVEIGEEISE